jgi:hypothetical protein
MGQAGPERLHDLLGAEARPDAGFEIRVNRREVRHRQRLRLKKSTIITW